jgi:hypothetical protein
MVRNSEPVAVRWKMICLWFAWVEFAIRLHPDGVVTVELAFASDQNRSNRSPAAMFAGKEMVWNVVSNGLDPADTPATKGGMVTFSDNTGCGNVLVFCQFPLGSLRCHVVD